MSLPYDSGSFRDRSSRVVQAHGRVFRALTPAAWDTWQALSSAEFFQRRMADGSLVATHEAPPDALGQPLGDPWTALLEHRRVPLVSYPYEWTFGMLRDAALLQLDLLQESLPAGFTLKDGTPYNVQWQGARPVFIDIGSWERYRPGAPWDGYRQFCQLQLFPLLLLARQGVDFQPWLRGSLEGITAGQMRRALGFWQRLRPSALLHVVLHDKLQATHGGQTRDMRRELRDAGLNAALVQATVQRLRKLVSRLAWNPPQTVWTSYASDNSYSAADAQQKLAFVSDVLRRRRPGSVWDLGCNTGAFSRLAAHEADYVVAMDADHASVERLYRQLLHDGVNNVLPLVMNLVDPSPGLGWRGQERLPLPGRGRPDLTLCLALLHHLVLQANVPLGEAVDWLADLGGSLIVEFVDKSDPMAQQLLRHKGDIFTDYDPVQFEAHLRRRFRTVERRPLALGTRILYFAEHAIASR